MIFCAKILFVGLITIATTWGRLADARMERERNYWLITRGQIESAAMRHTPLRTSVQAEAAAEENWQFRATVAELD
jgi:hypothetical protein